MRWSRELFLRRSRPVAEYISSLREFPPMVVALPQDEFINTDILDEFLSTVGASYILTCSAESEWRKIYPKSFKAGVKFKTVLTGYLDESTVAHVSQITKGAKREIDVGYRAWRAHPSLGDWGRHKVKIAEEFSVCAERRGLVTDISLDDKDTFLGDDWFHFLSKCKATIGVTGGASILDADGSIKHAVDEYLLSHPSATYSEVHERFLSEVEGSLNLSCISPRHLEACITKTVQFLVEADYSGILMPNEHYFSIKKDYSNINEAFSFLKNHRAMQEMADRAFELVVGNRNLTYQGFVAQIDGLFGQGRKRKYGYFDFRIFPIYILKLWNFLNWKIIRYECYLMKKPKSSVSYLFYSFIYAALRKIAR